MRETSRTASPIRRRNHVYRVHCRNYCATFTWRNVSGNLSNMTFDAVAINPNIPNQILAGSDWSRGAWAWLLPSGPIDLIFEDGFEAP